MYRGVYDVRAPMLGIFGGFCGLPESLSGVYALPSGDVMALREIARLLKVAEKTVYTTARRRELPAFEVRGQ